VVHEVSLGSGENPRNVWLYLPESAKDSSSVKLSVVLIAPAGILFSGMELEEGDRKEHIPYVRDGFAVVAYSLDGPLNDWKKANRKEIVEAVRALKDANAGLENARVALDYVLAKSPILDASRIYAVGHSSAGVIALHVAANEQRIKGCVAFAPATDLVKTAASGWWLKSFASQIAGFEEYLRASSPIANAPKLRCPVFLFNAEDDDNNPIEDIAILADMIRKTNTNVTFVRAKKGGHFYSMIQEGIPQAIQWLKAQPSPQ
jgi:dipeptidyl aminopeptidase/acylaminoacyl peptidase